MMECLFGVCESVRSYCGGSELVREELRLAYLIRIEATFYLLHNNVGCCINITSLLSRFIDLKSQYCMIS